jgi:5-methylcytosine-specific restriction endonuclease McrA
MGAKGLRDLFGDRKLGNESKVTSKSLYKMIKDQEFRCALSGFEISPETAALDHKKPLALGGGNELENLQWVHRDVNTAKGMMIHDAFVEMCRRVSAWQG